ncbi:MULTISPECIES: sugar O-acetyltransferase [Vagococcus]|uniref:sugar O-acetyltransferase n=1 Tax=Vagococcus TaxID=2737 RepID=UPI002FC6E137
MDMRKRMSSGELFLDNCQNIDKERTQAKVLVVELNQLDPSLIEEKQQLIHKLLGKKTNAFIETPFHITYGTNTTFGENCYVNYNCNFIDDGQIKIGNQVLIGANVTIITVGHPINPNYRQFMFTEEVVLKDNCWIGAGVIINSGVTIGENSVIGSGSVVTKDIPDNCIAVGNPCRVLREITAEDMAYYRPGKKIDDEELKEVTRVNQTT